VLPDARKDGGLDLDLDALVGGEMTPWSASDHDRNVEFAPSTGQGSEGRRLLPWIWTRVVAIWVSGHLFSTRLWRGGLPRGEVPAVNVWGGPTVLDR
jgi:hypothetical protein